jgi:hypothetical protein
MAQQYPIYITSSEEDPSEDTYQSDADLGINSPSASDNTSDAHIAPLPTAPVVTPTTAPSTAGTHNQTAGTPNQAAGTSHTPVLRRTARTSVQDFPMRPLAPRDKAPVTEPEIPDVEPPQKRLRPAHLDWMPRVLGNWRSLEGIPSTFEIGESSRSPPPVFLTGEPMELTVPTLVAVVHTLFRMSTGRSREVMELMSDASRIDGDMACLQQRMDFVESHRQSDWQSLAVTRARVVALERRARVAEIMAGICVVTAALMAAVGLYFR